MKFLSSKLAAAGAIALSVGFGAMPAGATDFINILTGGTSGVYYPLGVALSKIYSDNMKNVKVQVQSTKASVENLNLLQQGRGEIAFALGDSVKSAWQGDKEAGFPKKLDKLRAIAAIYPNYVQIVATKSSGIKTFKDLKGHSLSVGAPKSGTELNARRIFDAMGMSYKDLSKTEYLLVRRIGAADEEPPARRHASVGRSRRRLHQGPRLLGADPGRGRSEVGGRQARRALRRSRYSGRHL